MKYKIGKIEGVEIIKLEKYADRRGGLIETFRKDIVKENLCPVMSYVSYTKPGMSRGPHEHLHQTDIFSFIGPGKFKLKLWDNREKSKTYGNTMHVTGGDVNPITVIIPPRVIHGYKNISKKADGMVINYPDKLFKGTGKRGKVDEIRHEDKDDEFYRDFIK